MKTVLITNGNILSLMSLKNWINLYGDCISCLVITTKLPSSQSNLKEVFNMLTSSGVRYTFFKVMINKLIPYYYKISNKYSGVEDYLKNKFPNIEVLYADDVNLQKNIEIISKHKPDVILSFSATSKFKESLIKIPKRACINVHYALLPAYAGLSPYYWYLHNEELECGCTFHNISSRLDAGDIIERKTFSMNNISSVMGVLSRQIELISPMLINYYSGATLNKVTAKQNLEERTYYRHPLKKDIKLFISKGYRFFDKESFFQLLKGIKK